MELWGPHKWPYHWVTGVMSYEPLHFHWWPGAHPCSCLETIIGSFGEWKKWNAELMHKKPRERWKSPSSWKGKLGRSTPKNPSILGLNFPWFRHVMPTQKRGRLRIGNFSGNNSAWTNWSFHSTVLGHSCAGNQENGGWCVFGRF